MNRNTVDNAINAVVVIILSLLIWTVYNQGDTITEQRILIKQMQQNPACTVPVPTPSVRRGRFV